MKFAETMPKNRFHRFRIDDVAIRYSNFAPRLFNFCLSLGMKASDIMPSRAFCSDENQGYPIIFYSPNTLVRFHLIMDALVEL
ncbi:hypothetical protein MNBD_GAMMA05-1761 [hydrothermal vent metagenome]|uniref:Uncharacterized protein n=1 Tax=hydrothermal vent metagenome TaxID=652676 RepID=A0A3B0W6I8_9ZZZZ